MFSNFSNSFLRQEISAAAFTASLLWQGFTRDALAFDMQQRASTYGRNLGDVVDITKIDIPAADNETHTYVGWDESKISEVGKDKTLYTTQLSVCIAVLSRAFKEGSSTPSHTALNHVWVHPKQFG